MHPSTPISHRLGELYTDFIQFWEHNRSLLWNITQTSTKQNNTTLKSEAWSGKEKYTLTEPKGNPFLERKCTHSEEYR